MMMTTRVTTNLLVLIADHCPAVSFTFQHVRADVYDLQCSFKSDIYFSGIGTSSVYCDNGLRRKGFPYECEKLKNKTIVVKTHNPADVKKFEKVVFIIRSPFTAFLTFSRFKKAGHTGTPDKTVVEKG